MSEFFHIQDAHLNLLRDKGYHEKDLGSPNKEGLLFKNFQSQLSTAVNEALRFNESTDFSIDAIGYFEKQLKNPVNINIAYRFDPDSGDLSINRFTLEMDGKVTAITIHSNKELPHAQQIPAILQRESLRRSRILRSPPPSNSTRRKL